MENRMIKPGDKVKCILMHDDPRPVRPGMIGEVQEIDDIGTVHVKWEDGRLLGILPDIDEFEII